MLIVLNPDPFILLIPARTMELIAAFLLLFLCSAVELSADDPEWLLPFISTPALVTAVLTPLVTVDADTAAPVLSLILLMVCLSEVSYDCVTEAASLHTLLVTSLCWPWRRCNCLYALALFMPTTQDADVGLPLLL